MNKEREGGEEGGRENRRRRKRKNEDEKEKRGKNNVKQRGEDIDQFDIYVFVCVTRIHTKYILRGK